MMDIEGLMIDIEGSFEGVDERVEKEDSVIGERSIIVNIYKVL